MVTVVFVVVKVLLDIRGDVFCVVLIVGIVVGIFKISISAQFVNTSAVLVANLIINLCLLKISLNKACYK